MSKDDFLGRWSKRKLADEQESPKAAETVVDEGAEPAFLEEEQAVLHQESAADLIESETDEEAAEHEPHPAEGIDIETLEYESDFTVFMDKKVPKALKRMALRKLWRSNPILANVDGLNDYDEDFSDAVAVFINSSGDVISGTRDEFWDEDQIAEGKDRIEEEAGEEEIDAEEVDAEETEQKVAEAEGSEIDDIDDGVVESAEDFDDLELAQSSHNAESEETDKKLARKTEPEGNGDKAKS